MATCILNLFFSFSFERSISSISSCLVLLFDAKVETIALSLLKRNYITDQGRCACCIHMLLDCKGEREVEVVN